MIFRRSVLLPITDNLGANNKAERADTAQLKAELAPLEVAKHHGKCFMHKCHGSVSKTFNLKLDDTTVVVRLSLSMQNTGQFNDFTNVVEKCIRHLQVASIGPRSEEASGVHKSLLDTFMDPQNAK